MSSKRTFREKPSSVSSERGGNTNRRDEHSLDFFRLNEESDPLAPCLSLFNDCRKDRKDFTETHSSVSDVHYYGMDNGFNGSSRNSQPLLSRRPHSRHDFRISLLYAKPSQQANVSEEPTTTPALDGSA
ncbi:hypothetical protein AVEN_191790-1 [Araneus ventricosus]|uniref:Uncharacterized protein n=1 Tax=Araneus ventricosus TaxID=182803 RepID=A0A4Y2QLD2_ARAVE|nr:hypothetical protein AVEN_191790-1 [Araneus ventricosus]